MHGVKSNNKVKNHSSYAIILILLLLICHLGNGSEVKESSTNKKN